MMQVSVPLFSIVIPTRDRAAMLSGCIQSLARVDFDRTRFEVIVVDNGSRDDTRRRLIAEMKRGRLPMRMIVEHRLGPSHARNAGIRCAAGRFINFLDDDARVTCDWFAAYERAFCAGGHSVIQGRVIPRFLSSRPLWLTDELASFLGRVDEGESFAPLRGNVNSCNIGVAREVIEAVGAFRTDLGPGGSGMGEDTDFAARALRAGFKIVYAPDAVVYHLISRNRTTRAAVLRRLFSSGFSQPLLERHDVSRLRALCGFARGALVRVGSAAFASDAARQMSELCDLAQQLGRVAQIAGWKRDG